MMMKKDRWIVLGRPIRDFRRLTVHTVTLNKTTGEIGIDSVKVFSFKDQPQRRTRLESFEREDLPVLVKQHIRKCADVIKAKTFS